MSEPSLSPDSEPRFSYRDYCEWDDGQGRLALGVAEGIEIDWDQALA